jgi:hypothetical protein
VGAGDDDGAAEGVLLGDDCLGEAKVKKGSDATDDDDDDEVVEGEGDRVVRTSDAAGGGLACRVAPADLCSAG